MRRMRRKRRRGKRTRGEPIRSTKQRIAQTSVETDIFSSLTLSPWRRSLPPPQQQSHCMDVRTSPKPSMHSRSKPPSPPQLVSPIQLIYQSSLAIASFLSLSLFTVDCIIQGLDQEEIVTGVQKGKKGCPIAPRPDRQWRDIFSLVMKSQRAVRLPHLPFMSSGKGKSQCLHHGCFVFFVIRKEGKQCSVMYRGSTSLF